MSTFSATITASADDAQEASNVVTLTDSNINVNATTQTGGLRFLNVTIPQGSTINSATLSVYLTSGSFDDPYITIKGEDADDSAAFSAVNNDITSRTTTTASVTWDATGLGIGVATSPDIKTVIQEIIDRASWASGNDLALIISAIDNTSLFRFRALDATGGDYATLDVDYTAPGSTNPGTTDLISWWSLDETSGTRADSHGSNDLADNNTVLYGTGKQGNAADFESSATEYLSIASNASVTVGDTDFTIAAWVNLESTATTQTIAAKGRNTLANYGIEWVLYFYTVITRFSFAIANATTINSIAVDTFGAPSTATWYFVVSRHSATNNTIDISVNAGTADSAATTIAPQESTSGLCIGAYYPGNSQGPFDGLIDEVCYYNRYLSDDEISWLYNSGSGRAYTDLSSPSSSQPPRTLHQFRQRKP